jgi:hypothetical protein
MNNKKRRFTGICYLDYRVTRILRNGNNGEIPIEEKHISVLKKLVNINLFQFININ